MTEFHWRFRQGEKRKKRAPAKGGLLLTVTVVVVVAGGGSPKITLTGTLGRHNRGGRRELSHRCCHILSPPLEPVGTATFDTTTEREEPE
ncbi:hypothetical protein HN51_020401 [Arachis hypogaea]